MATCGPLSVWAGHVRTSVSASPPRPGLSISRRRGRPPRPRATGHGRGAHDPRIFPGHGGRRGAREMPGGGDTRGANDEPAGATQRTSKINLGGIRASAAWRCPPSLSRLARVARVARQTPAALPPFISPHGQSPLALRHARWQLFARDCGTSWPRLGDVRFALSDVAHWVAAVRTYSTAGVGVYTNIDSNTRPTGSPALLRPPAQVRSTTALDHAEPILFLLLPDPGGASLLDTNAI